MKWNDVYVDAIAMWLGDKENVDTAVAENRYDAEERVEDDYESIRVAGEETPAEMAVWAAEAALKRSAAPADDFDLIVHASVGFQGLDHWSPASYIQNRTVGGRGSALEVKQASNGGLAALEMAAAYLAAGTAPTAALVTTADKYTLPAFDRYRSDKGLVRGDGATGLVLTREPGVARLLSTGVISDTTHEALYRGDRPWSSVSGTEGWPVDLRLRRKEYLSKGIDIVGLIQQANLVQQEAIQLTLDDAGVPASEITRWVFPNAGRGVVDWDLRKRDFGIEERNSTWAWGRTVGHIGAGDQFAGLTHLLETAALRPGDKVALAGIGAGFTYGAAVLEIVTVPEWPDSDR